MAHDYKALAKRVYGIFERGSIDELATVFAPGFKEHEVIPGSDAAGIVVVEEWVTTTRAALPDLHYTIESVVGNGNELVCRVRLTGTHKGVLFGIPPTGKKVDVLLMDWVRLTPSGKVAEHWGLMQEGALMAQLGVTAPGATIDLTTPATTRESART